MKRPVIFLLWFLVFLGAGVLSALELGRIRLEHSLTQLLKTPVRIQRLTFSPRKLTLHRITLGSAVPTSEVDQAKSPLVLVDRLQMEGSLLSLLGRSSDKLSAVQSVAVTGVTVSVGGLPLQAHGRLFLAAGQPHSGPSCEGWFMVRHPLFQGKIEISGNAAEPILMGWVEAASRRHFVAQMRISSDGIRLTEAQIQGGWTVRGQVQPFSQGRGGRLSFWIRQEEEVPEEVSAEWTVSGTNLDLKIELLEGGVSLNGWIRLRPPYPMDLVLQLKEAPMEEFLRWLPSGREPALSGMVDGRVTFAGSLNRLISQGELSSREGSFGEDRYDLAVLRFQGLGPVLEIKNSQVTRPSGVLLIEGTADLRRLGQPDFFSGLTLSSTEKSLGLGGGWRVGPLPRPLARQGGLPGPMTGSSGLQVHRPVGASKAAIGLAYEVDREIQSESITRKEMVLEVPLSPGQRLNMRLDQNSEFLGVEHRKKF